MKVDGTVVSMKTPNYNKDQDPDQQISKVCADLGPRKKGLNVLLCTLL